MDWSDKEGMEVKASCEIRWEKDGYFTFLVTDNLQNQPSDTPYFNEKPGFLARLAGAAVSGDELLRQKKARRAC
jgi:hypothetical protein